METAEDLEERREKQQKIEQQPSNQNLSQQQIEHLPSSQTEDRAAAKQNIEQQPSSRVEGSSKSELH